MKILCYGDSNTYGYDPRSYLSDRYPDNDCWTTLLQHSGYSVLNYGMNGREIPHCPGEINTAIQIFTAEQPDILQIMLGSNDLLMNPAYTAEDVTYRMDAFLQAIRQALPELQILLLSPVPMQPGVWVQEDRLLRESARLGGFYKRFAEKHGIAFADTTNWNVPLTFDGVHFSEAGHRAFFAGLAAYLASQN